MLAALFGLSQLFVEMPGAQATTYDQGNSKFTVPKLYQFSPRWNGSGTSKMGFSSGWTSSNSALIGSVQGHCEGYRVGAKSAKNKYVTITNVGWFKGKSVDLKITITNVTDIWGSAYIAIQKNFNKYVTAIDCSYCTATFKYDFYYSGTSFKTSVSDLYWYNYFFNITRGTIAGTNETYTINANGVDKAIYGGGISRSGTTFTSASNSGSPECNLGVLTLHHGSTFTYTVKKGMIIETSGSRLNAYNQNVTLEGHLYDVTSGSPVEFTSSRVSKTVTMYSSDTSATTVSLAIPTGYELKYSRTDKTTNDAKAVNSATWQYANSNHYINVYVAKKNYTITTTVKNGTIDPSCTAEYGSSKTISYAPSAGYKLKSVTVDGANVTSSKPSSQTFSNISANHTVAVVYEPITVPFKFTKTDASGTALSGAKFTLMLTQDTTASKLCTSTSSGLVDFGELPSGTYTMTESEAPAGYVASGGSWTVTVDAVNSTVTIAAVGGATAFTGSYAAGYKLANAGKTVPFSFTKTDGDGAALSGAKFTLKQGSTTIKTVTSTSAGLVDFGSLGAGTYTLTEDSAPAGYVASGGSWTVTVNAVNSTVTVAAAGGATAFTGSQSAGYKLANAGKTVPFSFTKTDDDGAALSGAKFTLKQGSTTIKTVTSTSAGTVDLGSLGAGTYTLTEDSAPAGYTAAGGSWTVTVDAVSETVTVAAASGATAFTGSYAAGYKLANKPKEVPFSFTKTDDTGTALAGAKFKLVNGSTTVGELESGTDGKVDFGSLRAGTYTLTETSAPTGYTAAGGSWTVTVNAVSETVTIAAQSGATAFTGSYADGYKLVNALSPLPFSFTKTDAETGDVLAGARFGLYSSTSMTASALVKSATSTDAGLVDFGTLDSGTYYLSETTAPDGYKKLSGYWRVDVNLSGSNTVALTSASGATAFTGSYADGYSLANERPGALFSFTKTNETGKALAGASFELRQDDTLLKTVESASDGTVSFGKLETGTYVLTETAAPSGYEKSDGSWTVVVDGDNTTVSIISNDGATDFTGSYADGYKLANKNDSTVLVTKTVSTSVSDVPPAGSVVSVGDRVYYAFTITNSSTADAEVSIRDYVPEYLYVGSVWYGPGNVAPDITGNTITWQSIKVPAGTTYTSKCTIQATVRDTAPSVIRNVALYEVDWDGTGDPAIETNEIVHYTRGVPFSFTKTDQSGTALAGATFELKQGDTVLQTVTSADGSGTTATGLVDFGSLGPGTYTLTETFAPTGYEKSGGSWTVVVDGDNTTVSIASNDGATDFTGSYADGYSLANKAIPIISVTKTAFSPDFGASVSPGDMLIYTFEIKNNGAAAASLTLRDYVPEGTVFLGAMMPPDGSDKAPDWDEDENFVTWDSFNVPVNPGYGGVCALHVKVLDDAPSVIRNVGLYEVDWDGTGDPANETNEIIHYVPRVPFSFTKTDSGTGTALSGASFELVNQKTKTTVGTVTSGDDGKVDFGEVASGTYTLTETAAPKGYDMTQHTWTVVVDAENDTVSITANDGAPEFTGTYADGDLKVANEPLKGTFKFTKTNVSGAALKGAGFTLKQNGTEVATATSGSDGVVSFSGLVPGTYDLYEDSLPYYHSHSHAVWSDSEYFHWAVTLALSDDAKSVDVTSITSVMPDGSYEQPTDFEGSTANGWTLKNYEPLPFSFKKVDEDGNPLQHTDFVIEYGSESWISTSTDENGIFELGGFLHSGTYKLFENIATDGYEMWTGRWNMDVDMDARTISISIDSDYGGTAIDFEGDYQTGFTLVNKKPSIPFTFTKVDENDNPLEGAEFLVEYLDVEGQTEGSDFSWGVSDANGLVEFDRGFSQPGTYVLSEQVAPERYDRPSSTWKITVAQDSTTKALSISSVEPMGDDAPLFAGNYEDGYTLTNARASRMPFAFTKTGAGGNELQGATFELRRDGQVYATVTSDEEGWVDFGKLDAGDWTLVETSSPAGYADPAGSWTVSVDVENWKLAVTANDGATAFGGTFEDGLTLENEKEPVAFTFGKADSKTGTLLSGATFTLTPASGTALSAESGVDGTVSFTNLADGTYTLSETAAPDGYDTLTGTWTVAVDSAAEPPVTVTPVGDTRAFTGTYDDGFTLTNDALALPFSFIKTDSKTGAALSGATFTLDRGDGTVLTATSDASGKVDFGLLDKEGYYTLAETAAPSGYERVLGTWNVYADIANRTVEVYATEGTTTYAPAPGGSYADGYTIADAPDEGTVAFSFKKSDQASDDGLDLENAAFSMYTCVDGHTELSEHTGTAGSTTSCWKLWKSVGGTGHTGSTYDFGKLTPGKSYMLVEDRAAGGYHDADGDWQALDYELPSGQWLVTVPATATSQTDLVVEPCEDGQASADWNFGNAQAFSGGANSRWVINEAAATEPLSFTKKSSDLKTALPGFTFALYECTNPQHSGKDSHSAVAGGSDSCWGSYDADGLATSDPLKTVVSGADGTVDFGELPRGYYMLVETAVPSSYTAPSGREWEFEVPTGQLLIDFDTFFGQDAGDGSGAFFIPQEQREGTGLAIETGGADAAKNVGCAVVNTPTNLTDEDKTTDFTFTKIGDGDAALAGATFELYKCGNSAHTSAADHSELATNDTDCCWKVDAAYATATSGDDGVVSFTGLYSGQYMMVETASPEGYRRPYGQWMLDVDAVGGAVSVTARGEMLPPAFKVGADGAYSLPNYRNWTMPLAGAGGAVVLTAGGAALVTAAVVAMLFSRRRNERS